MTTRTRVMTVVGTRPEIIRLSRMIPTFDRVFDHVLVHTGQNTAVNLSDVFFTELGVRQPDVFLRVDTSSLGRQLGSLFERFEDALDRYRPQRVVILGDTNSALVAFNCKRRGIPVYHLEAGNRCYDDRVPEEVNRRVIDHCSSVLLPYTERSAENLVREGIARHRIFVTGNPIFEVLQTYMPQIDAAQASARHGVTPGAYGLATLHRAENTDDPEVLDRLCRALLRVSEGQGVPIILSVHPRLQSKLTSDVFAETAVRCVPAMPFFEFASLQKHARLVLTDSGTVQEECAILGVPVVTIRNSTERPETIEAGTNIVASTGIDAIDVASQFVTEMRKTRFVAPREYLVPDVSDRVVRILLSDPAWAAGMTASHQMAHSEPK